MYTSVIKFVLSWKIASNLFVLSEGSISNILIYPSLSYYIENYNIISVLQWKGINLS